MCSIVSSVYTQKKFPTDINRNIGRLQNDGWNVSCGQLLPNTHSNLSDQFRAEFDAWRHLQEQNDSFIAGVAVPLSHAQTVLDLFETVHCKPYTATTVSEADQFTSTDAK